MLRRCFEGASRIPGLLAGGWAARGMVDGLADPLKGGGVPRITGALALMERSLAKQTSSGSSRRPRRAGRHLTESQRAMIASELAKLGEGRPNLTAQIQAVAMTQGEAADLMQVSRRSVQAARQVQENDIAVTWPPSPAHIPSASLRRWDSGGIANCAPWT